MAQDKVGHALAFYNLLHELGEPDPDHLAFLREPADFRCCSLVALECFAEMIASPQTSLCNNPIRDQLVAEGDWSLSLVRQFLFSEADALRMSALESSAYDPLARLARKLRGEIKYHTLHGRTILKHLTATPDSRQRLQSALDALWGPALGMFEPTPHDQRLAETMIAPAETDLAQRWRDDVGPLLEQAGLKVPENARPARGGRAGRHPPEFARLIENMQKVFRLDAKTRW